MSVNKETKSSAEIINDLHTKLKKDGIILKGIRSDLLKLIKKYDDAYDLPILVSAIKMLQITLNVLSITWKKKLTLSL